MQRLLRADLPREGIHASPTHTPARENKKRRRASPPRFLYLIRGEALAAGFEQYPPPPHEAHLRLERLTPRARQQEGPRL